MKVGVIGLGSIGTRHAQNLVAMGHDVYVTDPHIPVPENFRVLDDIGDCEAIVIASPSETHYEWMVEAIRKKVHVFVEKPIATSGVEEVGRWIQIAKNEGTVIFVGNNLRMHSCVKKAKKWLREGRIGVVQWASFTLAQYNDKYKDLILNWGSHEIDLATYLLGPAVVAGCVADTSLADIVLRHSDSGVRSTIHLDYVTPHEIRRFILSGKTGMICVDLVDRTALFETDTIDDFFVGEDSFDENYQEEMEVFCDHARGQTTLIGATGEDGLRTLELCLAAIRMSR